MTKKRIISFIDGFNLYHAISALKLNHLKWLNLWNLSEAFIKHTEEELVDVYYFTAYATWLDSPYRRHQVYIKALEAMGVNSVLGHFKEKPKMCASCKSKWIAHEEKETDVNFAIHLLHLAHSDAFDKALLVTADSDLCPAIDMVKRNFPQKELIILTPPNRYKISRELRNKTKTIRIGEKHLKSNLLPDKIYDKQNQKIIVEIPLKYKI